MKNIDDLIKVKTIDFPNGIPAFEELKKFEARSLLESDNDLVGLFSNKMLFVCINPLLIYPNYKAEVKLEDKAIINNSNEDNLVFLSILSIGTITTANLIAPIVIDVETKMGIQIIIPDDKYPLQFVFDVSKIKGLDFLINYKLDLNNRID